MKVTTNYWALLFFVVFVSCQQPKERACEAFNLESVKLLPSAFYDAQQVDKAYILQLDVDKLLSPYLRESGIKPLKESYGNWENTGLDGHIGGHYLSACAMMYASTGDTAMLSRVEYMVAWLKKCQQANQNGYVGSIPGGKKMWEEIAKGDIRAATFSLNDKWVPLYNIHKIFAGLRDAYLFAGSKTALEVLTGLSSWFYDTAAHLTDEQLQKILISEHGGMNEIFVDVYEFTGDKRYLEFAKRFSDMALLEPLTHRENKLPGMHANTQIPKVIGYKRYADVAKDSVWGNAVDFFWETVVNKMSVSIGGNSVREHFHSCDDFSSMIESEQGPETCNTYNMLKLTKLLYEGSTDTKYMDYYERALYNHILSSQHPEHGGFVYFTPMRPQHYRVYSTANNCFWCCVGSGLENHTKYGEMIYAHTDGDLLVNLFIPSELSWDEKGLKLTQQSKFPYGNTTTLKVESVQVNDFSIKIRVPSWTKRESIKLWVKGDKENPVIADGFLVVRKDWKKGDEVKIEFPMEINVQYLPDHSNYACVNYGPVVLAAKTDTNNLKGLLADDSRMGHIAKGKKIALDKAPTIISENKDFSYLIKREDKSQLRFSVDAKGFEDIVLQPFYEVHDARYVIYWPVYTKQDLENQKKALEEKERQKLALIEKTIDEVAPGEQQPESDHFYKGYQTNSGINGNNFWRDSKDWFSYQLNDPKSEADILQVEYFGLDANRQFDIELNGMLLASVHLKGDKGDVFYTVDYKIPDEIKKTNRFGVLLLKFVAKENSVAGGIYHVRLLR